MVHWVGNKSEVVICLARDPTPTIPEYQTVGPSSVYISYDYGTTYESKTKSFLLADGSVSTLEKFFIHPTYNTYVGLIKGLFLCILLLLLFFLVCV